MKKISTTVFLAVLLFGATQARAQQQCSQVRFAPGRTSSVINGKSDAKGSACYKLHVRDGQRAIAHLTSPDKRARLSIGPAEYDSDFLSGAESVADWEGELRSPSGMGDFLIMITAPRANSTFTLEISIPATSRASNTAREATARCGNFSGTYTTDYGPLKLKRQDDHVTGIYGTDGPDDSRVDGTVNGNILTGRWKEPASSGTFRFVLAADGRSFKGSFKPDGRGAVSGEWSGRCERDK